MVIEVDQLGMVYGQHRAVDNISFSVERGEIFGVIGPNGAGKTTTVESIIGLRQPTRGNIRVLGLDPIKERDQLSQKIGVQLQEAQIPDRMRVWEALSLFSSFYTKTVPWEPLLERWGLAEKRHTQFRNLSGGQKQRLFIALALLNDPDIVFLDELTTGLDPQSRRSTWELVEAIRDQGKTVILVTHFMDEAERLCDRMAIIDSGQLIALDTPKNLIEQLDREKRVIFTTPADFDQQHLAQAEGIKRIAQQNGSTVVFGHGPLLTHVVLALHEAGIMLNDIRSQQADLEDVFIHLTGKKIRV